MSRGLRASLSLLVVLFSFVSFSKNAEATFLPPNHLDQFDRMNLMGSDMDEETFNRVADSIFNVYAPIVKNEFKADLYFNKKWDDSTVNASANQTMFGKWEVRIYGGLARRPEISTDGFALVICHELGHHLGGYPFYDSKNWAASEGQADYFATQTCLKKVWKDDVQKNAEFRMNANPLAKKLCDIQFKTEAEQNLCYRVAEAGRSTANLMAALEDAPEVSFDHKDPSQVIKTDVSHPHAQCRMDTYFAGSICPLAQSDTVIPGRNEKAGQDSKSAEMSAAPFSCMSSQLQDIGSRPSCWFSAFETTPLLSLDKMAIVSSKSDSDLQSGDHILVKPVIKNNTNEDWKNLELRLNTDLSSSLTSSALFKAEKIDASSVFDQFESGAIDISGDAKCGDVASFYFDVQSEKLGFGRILYKDIFGKKVENFLSDSEVKLIPDSGASTLESSLENTGNGRLIDLQLSVSLEHERLSDLEMTLVAPTGGKYHFPSFPANQVGKVDLEYSIPNVQRFSSGNFTLVLKDKKKDKVGKLLFWSLKVKKVDCPN